LKELLAEVVVAAFALYRLDDDRGNIVLVCPKRLLDLVDGNLFLANHAGEILLVEREGDLRIQNARPLELGIQIGLHRISIGERQRVPRAAVEALLEVYHLRAAFLLVTLLEVLADLPVERRFQRVLDPQSSALDKEDIRHRGGHRDALEDFEKLGLLGCVDIGIRRLVDGNVGKLLQKFRRRHFGVIQSHRRRRNKCEEVEIALPVFGIDNISTAALLEINDDLEPVHQHVPGKCGQHAVGRDTRCRWCHRCYGHTFSFSAMINDGKYQVIVPRDGGSSLHSQKNSLCSNRQMRKVSCSRMAATRL